MAVGIFRLDEITNTQAQREHGDLASLKESIQQFGLLEPLVVSKDGKLLAGRRRYQVLTELGWEETPVCVIEAANKYQEFLIALHENTRRKQLTWQEEAHCALEEKRLYEEQFPETKHGVNRWSRQLGDSTPARYTEAKATVTDVGERTVQRQIQLAEALEEHPELAKAKTQAAAERKLKALDVTPSPPLPSDKYRCIVIDPPWPIEKIEREVRPNQEAYVGYQTMTLEEIGALDVPKLAAKDGCHVYLWVTHKFLPAGLKLFEGWDVCYQCLMTWVKPSGMTPYSWMYDTEHVLFGRIGSLPLLQNGLKLSFTAPNVGHSIKPDLFYERVTLASPGPRLEMFAREHHEGFTPWGLET